MKKLIRKGEVKEVYQTQEDRLEFLFTDHISVFDKAVPNEIPKKGETLCKTSSYWFEKIESEGLKTHFIERLDDDRISVEKFDAFDDIEKVDKSTTDYIIPLEFITRYFVAGSLHTRIENGELDHEELGFDEEPAYGDRLPGPFFEVRNKLEEYDSDLTRREALSISGLTEDEYRRIEETVYEIDQIIADNAEKNGLLHVDGKKEFAMNENRELVIADSFGNADEDRFWERDRYESGDLVQKNKELVSQYYKEIGYHDELIKARQEGKEEPPIPSLPEDMIEETSQIYIELMSRLTDGEY